MALIGMGTDTGGSVRIPAAFNGLVGFKPAIGRVDSTGVFPLSATLDVIGPMAQTVQDCAWAYYALLGRSEPELRLPPPSSLRVVVPTNVVLDEAQAEVLVRFEAVLERLRAAGARVEHLHIPAFDALQALTAQHGTIPAAEAYVLHPGDRGRAGRGTAGPPGAGAHAARRDHDGQRSGHPAVTVKTLRLLISGAITRQCRPVVTCTADEHDVTALDEFESRLRARFPEIGPFQAIGNRGEVPLARVLELADAGFASASRLPGDFQLHQADPGTWGLPGSGGVQRGSGRTPGTGSGRCAVR
jgi:hypothetical protein